MVFKGSCHCRNIQFEVIPPTKWCAHCHCTQCRRVHGAAFVTWFGVLKCQFRIASGLDSLKWYASSTKAQRGFCQICGSTLFFRSSRWEDEMHIVRASMEIPIDRQPAAHVFYDTHVDWFDVEDDLAKKGGLSGVEPLDSK